MGLHLTLLVVLPAFAFLTKWQLDRALGGNTLSWAYTFEWPLFAGYALYVWWQLIHDNSTAVTRRLMSADAGSASADSVGGQPGGPSSPSATGSEAGPHREPGWALSGGRKRNVAIATATAVDIEQSGRGERFTLQTEEEAQQLAAYNRYLAELAAADEAKARRR